MAMEVYHLFIKCYSPSNRQLDHQWLSLTFNFQIDMVLLDPQVVGGNAGVLSTV